MKHTRRVQVHVKTTHIVNVPVHTRPVVDVPAQVKKTVFKRTNLSDGCFLMSYYYRKGSMGELLAEDVSRATHCEHAVYDDRGNLLGSSIVRIGGAAAELY